MKRYAMATLMIALALSLAACRGATTNETTVPTTSKPLGTTAAPTTRPTTQPTTQATTPTATMPTIETNIPDPNTGTGVPDGSGTTEDNNYGTSDTTNEAGRARTRSKP